jgi:hypothetical protein
MSRLVRQLPWFALQCAIVGLFVWLDYERSQVDRVASNPGLAFGVGTLIAFLVTALPFILKDVVVGQWLFWRDRFRSRPRVVATGRDGGEARADGNGAGPARLRRELPEERPRLRIRQ